MLRLAHPGHPHSVVTGTDGADTLDASATGSRVYGEGGNDGLHGSAADDVLVGGGGDDTFVDQWGGDNVFRGGAGDDVILPGAFGGAEHNTILGGSGRDALDLFLVGMNDTSTKGATVDLRVSTVQDAGSAGTLVLNSIEDLYGTQLADRLTGTQGANYLDGEDGDDTVLGLGGNDLIQGYGYVWRQTSQHDLLVGGAGDDTIRGSAAQGYIQASSTLLGGNGDDSLTDGILLKGGKGADSLTSYQLDATLLGGDGNDVIQAFQVRQTLVGGGGADKLGAHGGQAVFLFHAGDSGPGHSDTITALGSTDVIDLHILSKAAERHLVVVDSFTDWAGQMVLTTTANGVTLDVDLNGDGQSDFHLDIVGRLDPGQLVV